MNNCSNCSNVTDNPKFCSRSCAAISNNKNFPKRRRGRLCRGCGKNKILRGWKNCDECIAASNLRRRDWATATVAEVNDRKRMKDKHPAWALGQMRAITREWNRDRPRICQRCGYSKHVEHAHIKPLSAFGDSDMLIDVIRAENVLILCRNCHWEFDNGLLEITDIPVAQMEEQRTPKAKVESSILSSNSIMEPSSNPDRTQFS